MKRFACVCALAALLLLPALAAEASSLPWGNSFSSAQATDTPRQDMNSIDPTDPTDPTGQPGQPGQPQGTGLRGIMPLLLMVGLYLLIRRTFRSRGGGQGPFTMNRKSDNVTPIRPDADDQEHLKDAYDQARRTWDAFTSEPGKDVPAGEPRPAGYEPRSEAEKAEPQADQHADQQAGQQAGQQAEPLGETAAPETSPPASEEPDQARQDQEAQQGRAVFSGDFDETEFLEGARLVFERLVEAMDALDPDMVGQFAGPAVVNDIKYRLNQGHQPAQSEVMRVDAKIMERAVRQGEAFVTVYYDALKRVSGLGSVQVRQIWKFTKEDNDPAAMWMLQSVEPVEA